MAVWQDKQKKKAPQKERRTHKTMFFNELTSVVYRSSYTVIENENYTIMVIFMSVQPLHSRCFVNPH